MEELSCKEGVGAVALPILLETSRDPHPEPDPEYDAQFDDHISWGGPAVRIEAAQGLISIARHKTCATANILEAVEGLCSDEVPAVRFQVAKALNTLYRTAPKLMWRLVEYLCKEEQSRGVIQGLLGGVLGRLAGAHPDRVVALTKEIFDRVTEGAGATKVRELCIDIFTSLYIWRNHRKCSQIVYAITEDPAANLDEIMVVLGHFREPLTYGPVYPPDPNQDAIRLRALKSLKRILQTAHNRLRNIESAHGDVQFDDWPQQDQESTKSLVNLIDSIGTEIYFASDKFDSQSSDEVSDRLSLTWKKTERFYVEAGPILDELADVGIPSLSHNLLQTLETFIPLDPPGVFLRIGRVIQGGQKAGYQYESLAVDLMVKLVERYLAEYRAIFREKNECRQTLLEVLDIFVQAGWPAARRLTYGLEEIFR